MLMPVKYRKESPFGGKKRLTPGLLKLGDHSLQADFPLPIRMPRSGLFPVSRPSGRNRDRSGSVADRHLPLLVATNQLGDSKRTWPRMKTRPP